MVWLQENIPEQSRVSVVHGDFRVDNLIFDAEVTINELTLDPCLTLCSQDPSKVKAVLDWELSTLGDPLADAAYGVMAHHIPSDFRFLFL